MDEEHYKLTYNEEYERCKKLIAFIEALESTTNNWDDLCDCPCNDGLCDGIHDDRCRTMQIRKDYENAFN